MKAALVLVLTLELALVLDLALVLPSTRSHGVDTRDPPPPELHRAPIPISRSQS